MRGGRGKWITEKEEFLPFRFFCLGDSFSEMSNHSIDSLSSSIVFRYFFGSLSIHVFHKCSRKIYGTFQFKKNKDPLKAYLVLSLENRLTYLSLSIIA